MESRQTNGIVIGERAKRLAELVVSYSVGVVKGGNLLIKTDPRYGDYARLIANAAFDRDAKVNIETHACDPVAKQHYIRSMDLRAWRKERDRQLELVRWCNTTIHIDNESDPDYARDIPDADKKVALFDKIVQHPVRTVLFRRGPHRGYAVRWNVVGFPSARAAASANMTLKRYADFVYDAALRPDWIKMRKEMQHIKGLFDDAKDVHILVPGLTDLHLGLRGRGGDICDGAFNMPDGEVFYGPQERSANGHITFQCPTRPEGHGLIEGIKLTFKDGKVVKHSATSNQRALDEILAIPGARRLGELGIGCNYAITQPTLEVLFDEKIGGTIHLALGEAYVTQPLSCGGGRNKSSIHWDIVCDLRKDELKTRDYPGGMIKVDGKVVQHNGKWTA
jgi:aminopeptidase